MDEEAAAKKLRWMSDPMAIELVLATMASITEIDFSTLDLDAPIPPLTTNGERGFLITSPEKKFNRRYVTEITDGLVPELKRRGLVRTAYEHERFRDNLLRVLSGQTAHG
jgi:hypothetical protein